MPPINLQPKLQHPAPPTKNSIISYPAAGVLLVHLNKPKGLNCINAEFTQELEKIWLWLDEEPTLSVGIITGTGRAFCAGADLKEWNKLNTKNTPKAINGMGFGALSRRSGKKPIIAAVNGICFGGGCEMIVNCDLVVAANKAVFALPEVKVGVVAAAGALPRIIRTIGKPRAMEMALTGRQVSAKEALEWGLINKVVGDADGEVVDAAVEYAKLIAGNSPDAVIVSREGIKLGWEGMGAEDATKYALEHWQPKLQAGDNMAEGVRAFVEKRKPRWKPSKL
ncbi:ClpP/crotonase [Sphaerulina musiva SO2202]|uniref:ClpP/crotonase n=1 Tax=Sphaerulina musiva (strain SO2202) TaxID=692275 RepID=N1QEI5_SPHMS|nr:ClpP/crotonase [Sphaerulina musiva SO2202]EMF10800.1 ClpP/crotonase [Sphaerulina musiva SO2202]